MAELLIWSAAVLVAAATVQILDVEAEPAYATAERASGPSDPAGSPSRSRAHPWPVAWPQALGQVRLPFAQAPLDKTQS